MAIKSRRGAIIDYDYLVSLQLVVVSTNTLHSLLTYGLSVTLVLPMLGSKSMDLIGEAHVLATDAYVLTSMVGSSRLQLAR